MLVSNKSYDIFIQQLNRKRNTCVNDTNINEKLLQYKNCHFMTNKLQIKDNNTNYTTKVVKTFNTCLTLPDININNKSQSVESASLIDKKGPVVMEYMSKRKSISSNYNRIHDHKNSHFSPL